MEAARVSRPLQRVPYGRSGMRSSTFQICTIAEEKVLKFYQFPPPDPYLPFQIVSVSGVLIRSSSDFSKLVKLKSSDLHTEIIIRRTPFGQVFHLKPDVEGQSLGVVPHANTPELKEVIPGSQAAQVEDKVWIGPFSLSLLAAGGDEQ